jgi:hypothetical protein
VNVGTHKTVMVFPDEKIANRFKSFMRKCVKAGATTEDEILDLWRIQETDSRISNRMYIRLPQPKGTP